MTDQDAATTVPRRVVVAEDESQIRLDIVESLRDNGFGAVGEPRDRATAVRLPTDVRPYLASGQLIGLVSGYDGAATYTDMLNELPTRSRERQLQIQLVGQNLATVAFLLLILAGNVAILVTGRRGDA